MMIATAGKMEGKLLEFHRNRSLAVALKQVGEIEDVEIIQVSSIMSSIHDSCFEYIIEEGYEDQAILTNKLYESLPSMKWRQTVESLVSRHKQRDQPIFPSFYIKEALNCKFKKETRDDAFEQLRILKELSHDLSNPETDNEEDRGVERHVICARQSQLRRRIFKLQRESDKLI